VEKSPQLMRGPLGSWLTEHYYNEAFVGLSWTLSFLLAFLLLGCGDPTGSPGETTGFQLNYRLGSASSVRLSGDSTRWEYRPNLNGGRPGLRDLAIEFYTPPTASTPTQVFIHGYGEALTATVATPGTYPVDDPDAAASFNVEFQIPDWYASGRQGSVRITAATTQEVRGTLDVQFDQMQGVEVIGSGRLTGSFVARHSDQPDWTP
jgi:hypothetical protein